MLDGVGQTYMRKPRKPEEMRINLGELVGRQISEMVLAIWLGEERREMESKLTTGRIPP